MISEAQAAEAPRIVIPTRPLEVPPELLALQPDAVVCYSQAKNPGAYLQSAFGTAAEAIQLVRDTIARQAAGRFYIFEAAQVLADANGFPARVVLREMHRAVEDGRLRFRDVIGQPVRPSDPRGEYMTPDDLNSWLEWAGVGYRFPTPQAAAEPSTSPAAPRRVAPPPAAHGTETRADLRAAAVLIGDILACDADEGLSARVREEQAARQESREQRHARGWFLVAELVKMHARQHGWTGEMEAAAERAALIAAGDGSLPVREFPEGFTAPAESVLRWCELSDFNAWLLSRGVKPLTLPQAAEAPAHAPSASASPAARPEAVAVPAVPEAKEARQARRHQMCIDAGLPMPTST